MRMKSRIFSGAAVVVAGVLAVTGCSPSSNQSQESEEQTLNLAIGAPPSNFQIGNWSGGDATLFVSVYETIVRQNVNGDIIPGIAESWEYSPDNTVLTLKIRKGQKFSDGTPLDAAAVVASLEVARTGSSTAQNLASIVSVAATDDSTVAITLSQPDAALLPSFTGPVGGIGSPKVLTDESSKLTPIGSGPYVLNTTETKAGATYVLDRNENYWDIDSYPFEHVKVQIIADQTATINALKASQIDFGNLTADLLPQFKNNSSFKTGELKPGVFGGLWLVDREGKVVPALKDVRVRQAINMVFDREAIATKLLGGMATPSNQVFNPTGKAYDESLLEETPFDVAAAKKLMADAGYADGFTVTMPSTPVTTTFEPTIVQALGEIGIKVNWESIPFQDFYTKVFGGTYGMYFMYNGLSGSDAVDANAAYSGVFNPYQYTDPEFVALRDAANKATGDDQAKAFKELNEYFIDNAWFAPLFAGKGAFATTKNVEYTPPVTNAVGVLPFKPAK